MASKKRTRRTVNQVDSQRMKNVNNKNRRKKTVRAMSVKEMVAELKQLYATILLGAGKKRCTDEGSQDMICNRARGGIRIWLLLQNGGPLEAAQDLPNTPKEALKRWHKLPLGRTLNLG